MGQRLKSAALLMVIYREQMLKRAGHPSHIQ